LPTPNSIEALSNTLRSCVDAAVKEAVAAHLAPAMAELRRQAADAADSPGDRGPERIVTIPELCRRLDVNRTTILRRERAGKLPRRVTFPDGRLGWSSIEIDKWFAKAAELPRDEMADAERAARLRGTAASVRAAL